MAKDSVADVLRALATGDKNRSETARFRDVEPLWLLAQTARQSSKP